MALTTFTSISNMLIITQTTGLSRYYGSTLLKEGKFAPSSDGLSVNVTIGGESFQIPFGDVQVNVSRATTLSQALTLLNSVFGV
jgi:hypothetical protein